MTLPCEVIPVQAICEDEGSGAISFSQNGNVTGTRKWKVPWFFPDGSSYLDFVVKLLGQTISGPSGQPRVTYPDVFSSQFPWLYCQDVEVTPQDLHGFDSWGRAVYRRAKITAKYMAYDIGETFDVSSQTLSMQEGSYAYVTGVALAPPPVYSQKDATDTPYTPAQADQAFITAYNNWIAQVSVFINSPGLSPAQFSGQNSINVLTIIPAGSVPQSGTFTINFTLPAIPGFAGGTYAALGEAPASASDIQAVLDGVVGNPGASFFVVTGGPLGVAPVSIEMTGLYAGVAVGVFVIGDSSLVDQDGSVCLAASNQTQTGKAGLSSDSVIAQPTTKIICLGEYSLNRKQVLNANFWNFISILGTVNSNFFLGFPPWTLLFTGVNGKRVTLPSGTRVWDLTFKFHFNPNSWNMVYRPDKGQWQLIASVGVAQQTYWAEQQAPNGAFGGVGAVTGPVHGWLYRPADFSLILMYS